MSKLNSARFVASLAITALTITTGLTPMTTLASEGNIKSSYNVQTTKSLVNALTRIGGLDKYETAVQIADYGWQSASTAVIAPSEDRNITDALAASTLAKAIDGPILLADRNSVPSATINELKKLGVTKVYIISGTAVISAEVENILNTAGIQTVRIGGVDQYETAVNIAKEIKKIKPYQEIAVTNSYSNADAISIASIAATKGIPILLVDKDFIPSVVSDFIKSADINKTYVIGGTAVVSDSVKDALPNAMRLGGIDRFDTNTIVLKQFENLIVGGPMFFANGGDSSLIDSITGAPMAAKLGGAIVLSNKEAVPKGTKEFIKTDIALKNPRILGGTAVMSGSAIQSLEYAPLNKSAIQNGSIELNAPNSTYKDKTVEGNILIDADNEKLQNVHVKGSIFLDPGKDGTATLDGVQADRIVVLSGADHSIYLKETQSDNLVVSSSSDVHVVAENGTSIGSTLVQSDAIIESQNGAKVGVLSARSLQTTQIDVQLQGTFSSDVNLTGSVKLTAAADAVIPKLNVSGATPSDLMQLAGQFPNVSISDSSSIDVLSGKVGQLDVKGTPNIVVERGAEITNLVSDRGVAIVSGGGTINGKITTNKPTDLDSLPSAQKTSSGGHDRGLIQTAQPVITGTISAGDTTISGTAEAGATVSIIRDGTQIGTATADGTTGAFTVTLNDGVTLSTNDTLSITASAPGKVESNVTTVTVAAASVQTTQPPVTDTVSAGDTTITGTAEVGATVSIMRDGSEIGTTTTDGTTGIFTVILNDGVTLSANDTLSITATAPGKDESNVITVTVAAAPAQTTQPTVTGTIGAGDTMIMGTAETEATVNAKRSGIEIGTATANGTTGTYILILNIGVTLTQGDELSITATAPGKTESKVTSITIAAALPATTPPTVGDTVRAGDTMISGTTDQGAIICILRGENIIGIGMADETGAFTVTLNNGVILAEGDTLSIHAKAPDKAMSENTSITVEEALVQPPSSPPTSSTSVGSGDTTDSGSTDTGTMVSTEDPIFTGTISQTANSSISTI